LAVNLKKHSAERERIDRVTGIAIVIVVIMGCFVVLRPFLSALLWSVILAFSTWPVYQRIESAVAGRKGLASGLMVLGVAAVLIVPLALLATSVADDVTVLIEMTRQLLSEGSPDPPAWVAKLPVVGAWVHARWQDIAGSGAQLTEALMKYLLPLRAWILRGAANLGEGLLYLSLSVFIAFFLYRDGSALSARIKPLFARIGGQRAPALIQVAGDTIKGVVYGVIGTALIQGFLVGIGLWIAGIPRVLLLGVLACILSLIPIGPALVWLPAALWLFQNGSTGWAVFLVIWGLLIVGTVDNLLKPYFIGKGSHLPFILVFLGTLGGVMTFGFLGLFLGPTLLAIAYASFQEWSSREKS
jgi:predicted PurR-regulated permease PerM